MAFESAFLSLMPDTVTVAPRGSTRSLYGVPGTAGTAVSYSARVVQKPQWVPSADGRRVLASAVAWLASTAALPADSVYTLPDGSKPPVLFVARLTDDVGRHHVKVVFGTMQGAVL